MKSVRKANDKFHIYIGPVHVRKARARQQLDAVMSLYFVDSHRGFALQCFSLTLGAHAQLGLQ